MNEDDNIINAEFPVEVIQLGVLAGSKLVEHLSHELEVEDYDWDKQSDAIRKYYKSKDVTLPTMLDGFEDFNDHDKMAFAIHFYECTKEYNETF